MKFEKIMTIAMLVACIVFIAGATIGTLAVPVILAMFYSWYWLFLYAGYSVIILYVVVCFANYRRDCHPYNGGNRK